MLASAQSIPRLPQRNALSIKPTSTDESENPNFYEALGFAPRALDDCDDTHSAIELELDLGKTWNKISAMYSYAKALGGTSVVGTLLMLTVSVQFTKFYSDVWLSESSGLTPQVLSFYAWLILWRIVLLVLHSTIILSYGSVAAQNLYDGAIQAILRAPMRFFDTTPLHSLLQRFGHDAATCDMTLSVSLGRLLLEFSNVLLVLSTSFAYTKWFCWLVWIPLLVVYFHRILPSHLTPQRKQTLLSAFAQLNQFAQETASGGETIRAFGSVGSFQRIHGTRLNRACTTYIALSGLAQQYQLRIYWVSHSLCAMILSSVIYFHHGTFQAGGVVGLVAAYALSLPRSLTILVTVWARWEMQLQSPERLYRYSRMDTEAPRGFSTYDAWPTDGRIAFQNVSFRYRNEMPFVLKHVSFHIRGGAKVAIVGPRGAGKTSIGMSLFRINEIATGTIKIDGIHIATLGTEVLRSSLGIIPAIPIVFQSTIRVYLDPQGLYTDDELWNALEFVQLAQRIRALTNKLETILNQEFSKAELKRLCFARIHLRNVKILLLNETIDGSETDYFIQRLARDGTWTVLTVASHLDTVIHSDLVMVLNNGQLIQYDTPKVLMAEGSGQFFDLVTRMT